MDPREFRQLVIRVAVKIHAIVPESVGEQNFSRQARDGDTAVLKELYPLL
jgi:hypothetical protein